MPFQAMHKKPRPFNQNSFGVWQGKYGGGGFCYLFIARDFMIFHKEVIDYYWKK